MVCGANTIEEQTFTATEMGIATELKYINCVYFFVTDVWDRVDVQRHAEVLRTVGCI